MRACYHGMLHSRLLHTPQMQPGNVAALKCHRAVQVALSYLCMVRHLGSNVH